MLLSNETGIIRVLQTHGDKSLVIDCIKRTMPKWILTAELAAFVECSESELFERTDTPQGRQLSPSEERIARNRFTEIAGVLPFVGDKAKRNQMIDMQKAKKQIVSNAQEENLQAKIDVVERIQVIASREKPTQINITHIRSTRQKEQKRSHLDFVKESEVQYG